MISTVLPVLSLIALGAAQSTSTANLFIPFADAQSLVASIAGSDATATSYVVQCANTNSAVSTALPSGVHDLAGDEDACGFDSPFTVVQGPSTVHYVLSAPGFTESLNCQLMGTTRAICTDSATGPGTGGPTDTEPPLQTATLSASDITFFPVAITAGSANAKQTGSKSAYPSATVKTTASTTASTIAGTKSGTSSTSSAATQNTNAAMPGSSAHGAGVWGALGVAIAGAML